MQPDEECVLQLKERKEKVEVWTSKAKTGHLPVRAVWQSYTQEFWSSMKYGLGACKATLKELESGLGSTDFYLISKLDLFTHPTDLPWSLSYKNWPHYTV